MPLGISVKNNIGLNEFLNKLEAIASEQLMPSASPMITRIRYRQHLEDCKHSLENFTLQKPIELAAEDLRIAAEDLGKITGKIDIEMILDEIFGSFCIGK
jgi:tRNA modification GTPase